MLLKEIIQSVQNLYNKGVKSDDTRLSNRLIYSTVLNIRANLFTQKINKRQSISDWNYQTLECIELVKAAPYECPCLPPVGCVILRTKEKLPKPLTGLYNGDTLQAVTSVDGEIIFSPTTWKDKKYKKGSKYTANKPDYYIRDNYLYVTTRKTTKVISITGLFEDPLEAVKFPSSCQEEECKDNTCIECISPLDMDLPIDKDTVKTLLQMVAQELLAPFSQGKEDVANNSRDSQIEESK